MAMASILPADPTLDEIRAALAPLIAEGVPFDGFGDAALVDAATRLGIDADVARLAFPGGGREMVDPWFADHDAGMGGRGPAQNQATRRSRGESDSRRVGRKFVGRCRVRGRQHL